MGTSTADKLWRLGGSAAIVSLGFLCWAASLAPATAGDALRFFKNYFVTGDYGVGGIGLRGQGVPDANTAAIVGSGVATFATGTISMSGIPAGADIVAAYLYWEAIRGTAVDPSTLSGGTFRGNKIVGKLLTPEQTVLACWSSGGGSGTTRGATPLLVYRADVLRFLPAPKTANGQPTGQRLVNDADLINHGLALTTVSLPDSGGGGSTSPGTSNQAFLVEGASLVVVYRTPLDPLRAIVIYDGGYTFNADNPTMTQTFLGFYEASSMNPVAKMTHIVANGRNFQEHLYFNGIQLTPQNSAVPSATDPFPGALGNSWDNLTLNVSSFLSGDDPSAETHVTAGNPSSVACLSWGAMVFSTTVQDTDGDGLLDVFEKSNPPPTDPNGNPLPNINAMGANPLVKDLFIEIDYLQTNGYVTNLQGAVPAHTHKPTQGALDMMGDAFKAQHINVHFDIGNNYQGDQYVIPYNAVNRPMIWGGEAIGESCDPHIDADFPTCAPAAVQFPDYLGTVTWNSGFNYLKNGNGAPPGSVPALPAHFDHARKDFFHYVLFAHTLGLPKWMVSDKSLSSIVVNPVGTATITTLSPNPNAGSVTILGAPANSGLNGTYAVTAKGVAASTYTMTLSVPNTVTQGMYNNYSLAVSNGVPRSNSGASDLLGGNVLVTLGRWENFVGTEYMNSATLMHELGHNLALRHGGDSTQPNCKPNYQSIMSYSYQVLGLLDPSGVPHVNYSGKALPSLNEGALNESAGMDISPLAYEPRWFAPLAGSFLDGVIGTSPAAKHCDGTPLNRDANGNLTEPATVRIDGTSLPGKPIPASPIDWSADTVIQPLLPSQDINFTGNAAEQLNGFNDWAAIDLRQIGSRRDSIGYSLDVGPADDVAAGGGNFGDLGGGNYGDLGGGNFGDLGGGNFGDLGSGNLGDLGGGNFGDLGGDLEFETAETVGNAPNSLSATVVGSGSTVSIDLKWRRPTVGNVVQFQVWRAACPNQTTVTAPCSVSPSVKPADIAPAVAPNASCGPGGSYNYCDGSVKNVVYLYFVTATIQDGNSPPKQSGASNIVAVSIK